MRARNAIVQHYLCDTFYPLYSIDFCGHLHVYLNDTNNIFNTIVHLWGQVYAASFYFIVDNIRTVSASVGTADALWRQLTRSNACNTV